MHMRRKPAARDAALWRPVLTLGTPAEGGRARARRLADTVDQHSQRRIPLTGADRQPVLLDDLPAHAGCEPWRRPYPAASTLLNRAEFRPG